MSGARNTSYQTEGIITGAVRQFAHGAFRLHLVGLGFVTRTREEELCSKLCKNFKEVMT